MKELIPIGTFILIAGFFFPVMGQNIGFEGQAIGWSTINPQDPFQIQGGLRYIPEVNFKIPLGNLTIAGEGSLNVWGSALYDGGDSISLDENISPYRAWIKLSGEQFELRAGLQKINFGSANMIRPLMWFDQLDPKDPLQLTKGVYGLLGRYYFLNNANIWLWGLYGNNERKGLEIFPSKKNSIEYGGRIQLPLPIGEIAATYHHRHADPDAILPEASQIGEYCPENRYALDAKIDIGVGAWFEGVLIQKNSDLLPIDNATLLNVGLDYTFNIGNGLSIMGEALYYMQGKEPFQPDQEVIFGGISLSYPLNIIHNLSAIVFVDTSNKELYRFVNWSMAFDRWAFYTMAFWNPEKYQLPGFEQEANIFSGAGFQFIVVFNY
jgi:hypothetical protein